MSEQTAVVRLVGLYAEWEDAISMLSHRLGAI